MTYRYDGNERIRDVIDERIPEGCKVTYRELRGYDSPDRWYQVDYQGKIISELPPTKEGKESAILIAMETVSNSSRTRWEQINQEEEDGMLIVPIYGSPGIPSFKDETVEGTLMLISCPKYPDIVGRKVGARAVDFFKAAKFLRDELGLNNLKEAVDIMRGSMPAVLTTGPIFLLEEKAEALRKCGCELSVVSI